MRHIGLDPRLFAALVVGVFMGALDLTIVAPALPHMGRSLGVSPAAVVLAFSIYAAFYAVSVPVMGKLADTRGYGTIYRASLLLFAGGSAVAAISPNLPILVIARIVQGIGGGGLFPVAQAIVGTKLPVEKQGRILGILVGVFALGGVLGPNLGGFFTQTLTWRWIFWVNVPLGVIGTFMIRGVDVDSPREKTKKIDWAGAFLVAVSLGSLVLSLESLRQVELGLFNWLTISFILAAAVGFTALVIVERRHSDPIVDVSFVASRSVGPLLLVSFFVGYALLAGVVFTPFYAQIAFGATTLASGAILNAAAAGVGLASFLAGRFTGLRSSRPLILLGMMCTAGGLTAMILLRENVLGLLAGLVLLGIGLGLTQGPISYVGLQLAPPEKQGQISGLIAITRSMGGATGITLAGVFLTRSVFGLSGSAFQINTSDVWATDGGGLSALDELPGQGADVVRQVVIDGLVHGWYWALGAALVGLIAAFFLDKTTPSRE
jgi:EmrB/QacA subfamily drug resistance transporter